jgi:hypothetical protein
MSRIRNSSVGEGVSGKKIAELIVPSGLWNSERRDECHAYRDYAHSNQDYGQTFPPRDAAKSVFNGAEGRGFVRRGFSL